MGASGTFASPTGGAGTLAAAAGIGVSGPAGSGVPASGSGGAGGAGIGSAGSGGAGGAAGSAGASGMSGVGGAAGGAGSNPVAACTGKPGMKRGKSKQMVMIGGMQRWYDYYAPSSLDPNTPVPLVLVPHGYFMDADIMYEVTKYAELAEKEKFVVAFPSGAGSTILDAPWNIGTPNPTCLATLGFLPMTQNDDQALVDEIIKFADADQCIDHNHVFMTGFSMGGYFTNTTGCNREEIKAIAPHSGGSHDFANCKVKNKPVLLMHFEGDELIPYMCATETRDRWLKLNGCKSEDPDVTMVKGGRCEYFKGCPANGQVAMCTFSPNPPQSDEAFKGHGWSGGYEPQPVGLSGYAIPETESATNLSWEFFKKYAW
jgi:poly(3-hydroxybutyrate) depolymerase